MLCLSLACQSCSRGNAPAAAAAFRMPVEDVFYIHGRGVVVTGLIGNGTVTVGDKVDLVRTNGTKRIVEVRGVETFRKLLTSASKGANVGILLADIDKHDVAPGDVLQSRTER